MRSEDIGIIKPERVAVGPSLVLGITLVPGQVASVLKYFSGGSLEIIDPVASGGATILAGSGYLLGTAEVLNLNLIGTMYITATGATAVAHLIRGKTSGS